MTSEWSVQRLALWKAHVSLNLDLFWREARIKVVDMAKCSLGEASVVSGSYSEWSYWVRLLAFSDAARTVEVPGDN